MEVDRVALEEARLVGLQNTLHRCLFRRSCLEPARTGMQLLAVLGRRALAFATTMGKNSSMVAPRLMEAESAGIPATRKMNMFRIARVMIWKRDLRFYWIISDF